MSFEQLVASNEIIGMVRRIIGGFEIDEESLALDLIDEVGPGGEFLTSRHTLKHFRENWMPELLCRSAYEKWEMEGKKDLGTKAGEKARFILDNHVPPPLPGDVCERLREIIESMDG